MSSLLSIYDSHKTTEFLSSIFPNRVGNVGLIFERFPLLWKEKDEQLVRDETGSIPKKFLETIKRALSNAPIHEPLKQYHHRIERMVELIGGISFELHTRSRFVTGLGATHPSETGFRWDRNLGVPIIPSSSIKGVLRTWYNDYSQEPEIPDWIGCKSGAERENSTIGTLILFDAIPLMNSSRPIILDLDIINPHYSEYYSDPVNIPPADYYSPIPVFFLTVASKTRFRFYIAARQGCSVNLQKVKSTLCEALKTIGIGAKTSVGYGQFVS